uniref:Glyoxylate reductase/hydroxypyruvate reductase n=1 Tax=Panstrongylus megistus TaxID=65343 RepID=A0A069DYG7_9HEMI
MLENFSREACITEMLHADAALIFGHKLVIDQELLDAIGPRLKVISQMGAGVNHIDVPYVKTKKILLGNTQNVIDDCAAEVAIMLALSVAHRAKEGFNKIKNEKWVTGRQQWLLGQEIRNSVVGIVGLGNIGKAIATRIKAFSPARIVYYGRTDKTYANEFNAERLPLVGLLQESDFVIICCSLTNETYHLIDASSFKLMKNTAILVNVGRGEIINQDHLVTALKQGDIFGAGLDVMTPEPLPKDHPLIELENCVLTPHIGSATVQTRNKMAEVAAQNILAALEGKPMPSPL